MIEKLDSAMDQITVDEKKITQEALAKLQVSQVELVANREILQTLAKQTIGQVGNLKKIVASIKPGTDDKLLLDRLKVSILLSFILY